MSADSRVPDGPFCAKCGSPAVSWIKLEDGRERPVCSDDEEDGEVIRDV